MEHEYYICTCDSPEHHFIIDGFIDELGDKKYKEIIITPYLFKYQSIFSRIWVAIKYIFGYQSKYGHWDSICLNEIESKRLADSINKFLNEEK